MCMLVNALTENFSFIQILTAGSTCGRNVKVNIDTLVVTAVMELNATKST